VLCNFTAGAPECLATYIRTLLNLKWRWSRYSAFRSQLVSMNIQRCRSLILILHTSETPPFREVVSSMVSSYVVADTTIIVGVLRVAD